MSMHNLITVVASTITYGEISQSQSETEIGLWMAVDYRHVVGDYPPSGVVLAAEKHHVFRRCHGRFPPATYLCVGTPAAGGRSDVPCEEDDMVLECGLPVDITQRFRRVRWRGASEPPQPGEWVAAIGALHVTVGRKVAPIAAVPVACWVMDVDPSSRTFGKLLRWQIGKRLPHDPDVLPYHSLLITYRVPPSA